MGVGIWPSDIAAIDLKAGTFYADFQVFLLRYYQVRRYACCLGGCEGKLHPRLTVA